MVYLAKLFRITQGIGRKYKNIGLEKFQSLVVSQFKSIFLKASI
jgi:hypothetical protein